MLDFKKDFVDTIHEFPSIYTEDTIQHMRRAMHAMTYIVHASHDDYQKQWDELLETDYERAVVVSLKIRVFYELHRKFSEALAQFDEAAKQVKEGL